MGAQGNGNASGEPKEKEGTEHMLRLLKFMLVLGVAAFAGLVGFAYLGDYAPAPQDIRQPVELDAD